MTRPVGRIEIWEQGAGSALYTIDDAVGIYYKEVLTDGVGNFNFTCYSHKGFSGTYTYPDIDLRDTVKIWLDYDTIAGDPNFIGKVTKRSGPLLTQTGWVRKIAGLSQGEILLRRFKKNKYYDDVGASTMVTEWANDLSLGTGEIEADATAVTLEVATKDYFDLIRWVSDYWANAGTQIKKDFYVNPDRDLVWKTRPFRTVGVESLSIADFLTDPFVEREIDSVKNDIVVYGAAEKYVPSDKDSWTESLTNWSASVGSVDLYGPDGQKAGNYTIRGWTGGAGSTVTFKRIFSRLTIRNISTVSFWRNLASGVSSAKFRLLAPDASNYFEADMGVNPTWVFENYGLGPNYEYDTVENPDGVWTKTGSPNWWDLQGIQFHVTHSTNDWYCHVDGFYFYPERWEGSASDVTSQNTYAKRELEVTDDKLHSDNDCDKRAETLLYQLKDHPIQITITVQGNDNVLVGDRLNITIPSEGISGQLYDVIAVENLLNLDNWTTTVTMVNSVNWRTPLQIRRQVEQHRYLRQLARLEKTEG